MANHHSRLRWVLESCLWLIQGRQVDPLLVVVRLVGFLQPYRNRVKVKAVVLFDEPLAVCVWQRDKPTAVGPPHDTRAPEGTIARRWPRHGGIAEGCFKW